MKYFYLFVFDALILLTQSHSLILIPKKSQNRCANHGSKASKVKDTDFEQLEFRNILNTYFFGEKIASNKHIPDRFMQCGYI